MTIPTTLEESFVALDDLLGEEDKQFLLKATDGESAALELHHSLGRYLRNEWGLWQKSALAQLLKVKHGIDHPDDMSHFILVEYIRSKYPTLWNRLLEAEAITSS